MPAESYPLRVADRWRLALAPEGAHLCLIVKMSVGHDRARGLDELWIGVEKGPR